MRAAGLGARAALVRAADEEQLTILHFERRGGDTPLPPPPMNGS